MVTGTTGFESQGGHAGGCGIPEDATSVMINFIAVAPVTTGHLRAWPYGGDYAECLDCQLRAGAEHCQWVDTTNL